MPAIAPLTARLDARLASVPAKIVAALGEIDQHKGRWIAESTLSPQLLHRLKRSVLVISTGASTRIEGSTLTDAQVAKLIQGLAVQTLANRDEQEVRGYFELLQNVFEAWDRIPFTEGSVKHLHRELLKYVEKDVHHRGDYKHTENQVRLVDPKGTDLGVVFDTTPAFLTPAEMAELIEWVRRAFTQKTHHPLLIIANFVVEFLAIHPFEDGNGRLSRLLTNLLLLKQGYHFAPYVSHEKLVEDRKGAYYVALRNSQKTFKTRRESIVAWLEFFVPLVLQQATHAITLLASDDIERVLSPKQLAVWRYLNGVDTVSPRQIVQGTGIRRPTVNQALQKLMTLQRIQRIGEGSAIRYRVAPSAV